MKRPKATVLALSITTSLALGTAIGTTISHEFSIVVTHNPYRDCLRLAQAEFAPEVCEPLGPNWFEPKVRGAR
jgi:hypothetical protein